MPLSLNLFNNEIRATNGDYGTQAVALSSELESAKVEVLENSKAYTKSNFLPLTGGTLTGLVAFTSTVSGRGSNPVSFNDGIVYGSNTFAAGQGIASAEGALAFGDSSFAGDGCFTSGFKNIAAGYSYLGVGVTITKTPQNLWSCIIPTPIYNPVVGNLILVTGYSDGFPAPGTYVVTLFSVFSFDLPTKQLVLKIEKKISSDIETWSRLVDVYLYGRSGVEVTGIGAVALGYQTIASGDGAFACGLYSIARNLRSTAFGYFTQATGEQSLAFGNYSTARGLNSFAGGTFTKSYSAQSFSYGNYSISSNLNSVAMGYYCNALGEQSIALGRGNNSIGNESFSCNLSNIALGAGSFAEGQGTVASGFASHAGGRYAQAAHDRTWIWKGSSSNDVLSTTRTDQFLVSADGGVFIPGNVGIGTDNNTRALTVSGQALISETYTNSLSSGIIYGDSYRETSNTYITITDTGSINIDPAWDGKVVLVNNSSNLDISLLGFQRVGFSVTFVALTPNTVSFSAGVGATVNSDSNKNKITAQFCSAVVTCYTSNTYLLLGNISN